LGQGEEDCTGPGRSRARGIRHLGVEAVTDLRLHGAAEAGTGQRRGWLVVAIALELGVASTAVSQDHADATDSGTLDVVTVTAQRRVEDLQATPISIAAISSETLERQPLTTTADLARYVPGLLIGKSTFGGQTYLRGVGQSNGVPGGESAFRAGTLRSRRI
jgi:outer membrane receptor protein involved in Fe transport